MFQATQQSQSIQALLEAEKEAAKSVQEARQRRIQRLKDAHTEALNEIDEYKKAKEADFMAFEASRAGTTSDTQTTVDRETDIKLQEISDSYYKKKDAVIKMLLNHVVLVKPEAHRNLKKAA